jgi:MFS family permease
MIRRRGKKSDIRRGLNIIKLEGLTSTILFNCLGGPFLTAYLLYLGATPQQIGIALAIPFLSNSVQIVMAFWMQHITNRKRMLLIFTTIHRLLWVSAGIIPFLMPKSSGIFIYLIALFIAFLNNAFAATIWGSMLGDIIPAKVRGKYLGIRNTILFAISSISLLAGGQILNLYPGSLGFTILFSCCFVIGLFNIASFHFYPNPRFEKSAELKKWGLLLQPFRNRTFFPIMLFFAIWMFLQGIAVPFFSYVMQDLLHIPLRMVSIISTVQNVAMLIGYYIWGTINTKVPTRQLILWTLPFITLACLLWGVIHVLPTLIVLFLIHILLGLGISGFNQLMFIFTIGDTPKRDRPIYLAIFNATIGICAFLGPLFGGILYKWVEKSPEQFQQTGISVTIGIVLMLMAIVTSRLIIKLPLEQDSQRG